MLSRKRMLLSTTMVPLVVFAGVAIVGGMVTDGISIKPAFAQCAPKKCNPYAAAKCNPCAAAKCNPCNPCAAAKCNPCNPCAAAKCNPCNPCAAGGTELTDAEAVAAYDCLLNELKAAYAKSGNDIAVSYADWPRYSKQSYQSGTHGGRYVQNYANAKARAYGAYENAGQMPSGAVLAKDSFGVKAGGRVSPGPLFLMEKMNAGFNAGMIRDYDTGLPMINLDRDQIIQALLNLLRNAVTSLEGRGKLTLRTRAIMNFTIGETRHPVIAAIEIEDDGPGIPAELQNSVFYPLVTGRADGTGLGLPVAQELLSRHGGLIEFESRPGRTVFSMRIPLTAGDKSDAGV